jgi:uncharacterized membrane protein YesL
MKFFSLDSKFYKIMMPVGEMMILNICFILSCLPLVTIGAVNTAMYTIMLRRLREEGIGTIVPFFKAWWSNLKVSTPFWLVQVFMTVSLSLTFFLPLHVAFKVIAGIVLTLVTLVFSIIYPQIARFRNRRFAYLRNALILLVLRLGKVLQNLALILSPAAAFLIAPVEFISLGFVWILFGFSAIFYFSAKIMQQVLQPLEELSHN